MINEEGVAGVGGGDFSPGCIGIRACLPGVGEGGIGVAIGIISGLQSTQLGANSGSAANGEGGNTVINEGNSAAINSDGFVEVFSVFVGSVRCVLQTV